MNDCALLRHARQIGGLVKLFGGKWAAEKFFPAAFAIYDKNTNYLHRMTCLLIIHVSRSCDFKLELLMVFCSESFIRYKCVDLVMSL